MRFERWGHSCRSDIGGGDDDGNDEEEEACENFFSNALGTYAKGNDQVHPELPDTPFDFDILMSMWQHKSFN